MASVTGFDVGIIYTTIAVLTVVHYYCCGVLRAAAVRSPVCCGFRTVSYKKNCLRTLVSVGDIKIRAKLELSVPKYSEECRVKLLVEQNESKIRALN